MNEQDIQETFDFELLLAELLLKGNKWKYKCRGLAFTTAKSKTNRGIIYINPKIYINSRDFTALRNEIRYFFIALHSGFANQDKFLWQRSAKKMGLITIITANDYAECELCQTLTPLTTTKRCIKCREIEKAVLKDPERARKILAQFDTARKILDSIGD